MADRKPRARRGSRPTVVIIDEAQNLDPKTVALAIAAEIAQKRAGTYDTPTPREGR